MSVSPAPLLLEDVVDLLALVPAEPTTAQQPTIPISDSGEPTQTIAPGAWSIPPPPPDYLENGPFAGSPVSSSLPRDMHSSGNSLYTDHHRPHPSTFAGQAQGPSSSTVHPTSSLMSHRTFQIEYQDMRPDPQETIPAEPPFPPQHVLRFGPNGHTPGIPLAIQPTSIPLPSSPSDEPSSPSSPRSSVSPATSTASLPYPPSPSDLRGTTLRWKIDQREDQGWRCECAIQPKKKKRHLESCPNNPNKPTDKCPYCSRIFRGGSRKSARSKHVSKFHKKHGSDRDESKGKR
ncbi:hypothetical protein FRB90_009071 [Tulasnella sp. 427]|nr:hypothetical protein FRB90_009071 [Tulasnella sp. 427]